MGKKKGQASAASKDDDDDDALLDAGIAENAKSKSMEAAKAPDGMHGQLKGLTPEKVPRRGVGAGQDGESDGNRQVRNVDDLGTTREIDENRE